MTEQEAPENRYQYHIYHWRNGETGVIYKLLHPKITKLVAEIYKHGYQLGFTDGYIVDFDFASKTFVANTKTIGCTHYNERFIVISTKVLKGLPLWSRRWWKLNSLVHELAHVVHYEQNKEFVDSFLHVGSASLLYSLQEWQHNKQFKAIYTRLCSRFGVRIDERYACTEVGNP